MLTAIMDERIAWDCLVYDEYGDLVSCGEHKEAHIEEAVYLAGGEGQSHGQWQVTFDQIRLTRDEKQERGAAMALPRCSCGVQTFLKADYSLKELWHCTLTVKNDHGAVWAYALRPQHARNLRAQRMLYERGAAPTPPILPIPPREAIAQATHLGNLDTAYALWFGFATVRRYTQAIGTRQPMKLLQGKGA